MLSAEQFDPCRAQKLPAQRPPQNADECVQSAGGGLTRISDRLHPNDEPAVPTRVASVRCYCKRVLYADRKQCTTHLHRWRAQQS